MNSKDSLAFATQAAEAIVKGFGIESLPVDPKKFAQERNIEVVAKATSEGVSGMLVKYGDEFGIVYATHLQNEGFENFSVGHELGHFYLPGHVDAIIPSGSGVHNSRGGFSSRDRYEMEADRFSAGFLMPRHLFLPALVKAGSGFSAIESLAGLCKTSLHATAIRYAQCCREPVAIIVSQRASIEYCFMSQALRDVEGIDWIRKRERLPPTTATFEFNRDESNILRGLRVQDSSDLQTWFGGSRSYELSEDVVGLGRYGRTLTVLYDFEIPEPEDEEEERRLEESWVPRFRR